MGLTESLRSLDQKYPSSFLGLVAGIIIGVLGIYLTMFYEKKPEILFNVISSYRVYDIRENIGSLQINFEGENIKEKGQTLSLITLKIVNPSRVDILKSFYDEKNPIGFEIASSRIIKCDVITASNQYLRDTLQITQVKGNGLAVSPIIFESDQFITLKMLVLHPETITPKIIPFGKIAGIKQIRVQEEPNSGTKISKFNTAYSGDILVQVIRVVIYGIGFVLTLIGVIISLISISDWLRSRKRKGHVKKFKKVNNRAFTDKEELIFKNYIDLGAFNLVKIERLLLSKNMLRFEAAKSERARKELNDLPEMPMHGFTDRDYATDFLIGNKIATVSDNEVVCDQDTVNTVRDFVIFLNSHIPDEIRDAKKSLALRRRAARTSNERVEQVA